MKMISKDSGLVSQISLDEAVRILSTSYAFPNRIREILENGERMSNDQYIFEKEKTAVRS